MDNNPLEHHYTFDIWTSSKLKLYEECPRKAFWRYFFGWDIARASIHLIYGEAWHRAMEHLLLNGYGAESVIQAAKVGEEYYRRFISASMDHEYMPKTPGNLAIALAMYVRNYAFDTFQVLHTEVGGAVELDKGRLIHFRLDSIVQDPTYQNLIISLEHKTASRKGSFEQYSCNLSLGTYTYALNSIYEPDNLYGVIINGVIMYKAQDPIFQRLPAPKSVDWMKEWFWTINHIMDRLEWDMAELNDTSDNEDVMPAFPKRTENCYRWGQCLYFDFCHNWANPLQHIGYLPEGFKVDWWDPLKRDVKAEIIDGKITPIETFIQEETPSTDAMQIGDSIETSVERAPLATSNVDMLNRVMKKDK